LKFSDFFYVGQPSIECVHCGVVLWYEVRVDKSKNSGERKFAICFQKGKVQLPFLQRPPKILNNLLNGEDPRSKPFLDNIMMCVDFTIVHLFGDTLLRFRFLNNYR